MPVATYPVRVEAALDSRLSRWLWLVKWVLVIPHYIVLTFLWIAFGFLSVVAFFGILFTGRYPRAIFDFNVGVLRWSWRVAYYAYGALGTDRYPPFTLADVPDYPAHLAIGYPDHLSRGLVLVKWWLLAIPHYVIVGLFLGGGTWLAWQSNNDNVNWMGGGLISLLVLVAAIVLAFTGRYPQGIFDFVLGMNRWVLRVAAYAGLMTDRYPPFRLDLGGHEPGDTLALPGAPPSTEPTSGEPTSGSSAAPEPTEAPEPRSTRGWTAARIVSVVTGSVIGLLSLGLFGAGGTLLWADQTQRQNGYLTSDAVSYGTTGYALNTEEIDLSASAPGWRWPSVLGDVRVRVTPVESGKPVFVGVAPAETAETYLAGVGHTTVTDLTADTATYLIQQGAAPAAPPAETAIWVAQASGTGTQTLVWPAQRGRWEVVVMNTDGSAGVAVRADVGAEVPALRGLEIGLLLGGVVLLAGGVVLIARPVYNASRNR
jgi:hypothetical protein